MKIDSQLMTIDYNQQHNVNVNKIWLCHNWLQCYENDTQMILPFS